MQVDLAAVLQFTFIESYFPLLLHKHFVSFTSYLIAMTMRVLLAQSLLYSALSAPDPLVRGTLCNVMYIA